MADKISSGKDFRLGLGLYRKIANQDSSNIDRINEYGSRKTGD